jgi:hypothetical protein
VVAHRKKAIVTKQKEAKNEAKNEYLAPGGVKKISNARVHGRAVGSMSYDPQVRSRAHQNMGPYTSTCMNSPLGQRRWPLLPLAFTCTVVPFRTSRNALIFLSPAHGPPCFSSCFQANLNQRVKQKSDRFCMST